MLVLIMYVVIQFKVSSVCMYVRMCVYMNMEYSV